MEPTHEPETHCQWDVSEPAPSQCAWLVTTLIMVAKVSWSAAGRSTRMGPASAVPDPGAPRCRFNGKTVMSLRPGPAGDAGRNDKDPSLSRWDQHTRLMPMPRNKLCLPTLIMYYIICNEDFT